MKKILIVNANYYEDISKNLIIGDCRPFSISLTSLHLIYASPCEPLDVAKSVYPSISFLDNLPLEGIQRALTFDPILFAGSEKTLKPHSLSMLLIFFISKGILKSG